MNLDTPQFENIFKFQATYLWLGTNGHLKNMPKNGITVYFKENGQAGAIMASGRAELIEVRSDPPYDPEHRLPGFENATNCKFYLRVADPKRLCSPIQIESLLYYRTQKVLGRSCQGVKLINDTLPLPLAN